MRRSNLLTKIAERLVLHHAVMAPPSEESEKLLQYLLNRCSKYKEEVAFGGRTPLAFACSLRKPSFARILIEHGARIDVRDNQGRNLLHLLLFSMPNGICERSRDIKPLVELLGKDPVSKMLCETTAVGSLTPFALWTYAYAILKHGEGQDTDIPAYIMSLESEVHLDTLDALGNTPIHTAVATGVSSVLDSVLRICPELLYRESATGVTPLEMAQDKWIKSFSQELLDRTLWILYHSDPCGRQREPSIERRGWELCSRYQNRTVTRRIATLKEAQTAAILTSKLQGEGICDMIKPFSGDETFWRAWSGGSPWSC